MTRQIKREELKIIDQGEISKIPLTELTPSQMSTLNPLVPPTSGLRMRLYERHGDGVLLMPQANQMLFLRAFRAISEVASEIIQKETPGVLLVSDDRPASSYLVEFFAKIFAYQHFHIYFQKPTDEKSVEEAKNDPYHSRMGTPYGSASVELLPEVDMVIVLTASHNDIFWHGIKIYFEHAIPISGRVMKAISERSLTYTEVFLQNDFQVGYLDANAKNNEYIISLVRDIFDLSTLKGKRVLLWPYMGHAPELQDLFARVGMDVVVVEEEMDPPNPTINIDQPKLLAIMQAQQIKTAILVDTDRDRIVFAIYSPDTDKLTILQPNTLYTAMHNILVKDFHTPLVNVRTIPSDPRCDDNALLTFTTGVGYKHLGMVLFSALGIPLEDEKFQTGILYQKTDKGYVKCNSQKLIQETFTTLMGRNPQGHNVNRLVVALWEESGGHTFNILENAVNRDKGERAHVRAKFPPIGDKYPAEALLILTGLIEKGYQLIEHVDHRIDGTRTMLNAEDERKIRIIEHFSGKIGRPFKVGNTEYTIHSFEENDGRVAIIHLSATDTDVYFRPSGTGPGVRIYIFGSKDKIETQLDEIREEIDRLIP